MQTIHPDSVPKIMLNDGREAPCIGMGTFGSDRFTADQVAEAVYGAIKAGFASACLTAPPATAMKP